jgi:hypothetical protein
MDFVIGVIFGAVAIALVVVFSIAQAAKEADEMEMSCLLRKSKKSKLNGTITAVTSKGYIVIYPTSKSYYSTFMSVKGQYHEEGKQTIGNSHIRGSNSGTDISDTLRQAE